MARLRLPSSELATVTRDLSSERIQSDSGPSEVSSSQSRQLSASLDRIINNTWENSRQGSGDLPWMMNNDSQVEAEDTGMREFFKTGEVVGFCFY